MANDITIPAVGTGTSTPVVATEDIASSHYQLVKLAAGTAASTARLGQIDDAAFTPGTSAVMPIAAEFDDTSPDSVDEGDGGALRMSSRRELYTQIRDAAGNERGVNVSAQNAATIAGDVAHDTADAGNPVKAGAKATTGMTGATLVADGDRANLICDTDGALITRPYAPLPDAVSGNASNTDGTSTQVIAAQAAGIRTYITTAILTNTSASNIYVELKDGTTVMATIPLPANGGAIVSFPVPLKGTAATAWNYDPSAAATTTYCTLVGFKSKV